MTWSAKSQMSLSEGLKWVRTVRGPEEPAKVTGSLYPVAPRKTFAFKGGSEGFRLIAFNVPIVTCNYHKDPLVLPLYSLEYLMKTKGLPAPAEPSAAAALPSQLHQSATDLQHNHCSAAPPRQKLLVRPIVNSNQDNSSSLYPSGPS